MESNSTFRCIVAACLTLSLYFPQIIKAEERWVDRPRFSLGKTALNTEVWSHVTGTPGYQTTLFSRVYSLRDTSRELVLAINDGSGSDLYAFNPKGVFLWARNWSGKFNTASTPAIDYDLNLVFLTLDHDNDGAKDILVLAPNYEASTSFTRLTLLNSTTGSTIWEVPFSARGNLVYESFIKLMPDMNADGVKDIAVLNVKQTSPTNSDYLHLVDGRTGSLIYSRSLGIVNSRYFMEVINDITGDGKADLAITNYALPLKVVSGATGQSFRVYGNEGYPLNQMISANGKSLLLSYWNYPGSIYSIRKIQFPEGSEELYTFPSVQGGDLPKLKVVGENFLLTGMFFKGLLEGDNMNLVWQLGYQESGPTGIPVTLPDVDGDNIDDIIYLTNPEELIDPEGFNYRRYTGFEILSSRDGAKLIDNNDSIMNGYYKIDGIRDINGDGISDFVGVSGYDFRIAGFTSLQTAHEVLSPANPR